VNISAVTQSTLRVFSSQYGNHVHVGLHVIWCSSSYMYSNSNKLKNARLSKMGSHPSTILMPARGFCQRKLLQITAEETGRFSMRAATGRGGMPRVYCHRSTHYIVHCVGDVSMPTMYELIALIVLFSTRSLI
jgi:hypothetical protein